MISRPATHQFNYSGPYHGIIDGVPARITSFTKTIDYQTAYGPCGTIGRIFGPSYVHIDATVDQCYTYDTYDPYVLREKLFIWVDGIGEYRGYVTDLIVDGQAVKIKLTATDAPKISSAKHGKQYPSKHELRLAMKEIISGNTGIPKDFLTNRAALKRWLRSMQAERERTSRRAMRRQAYYDSKEPYMDGWFE